MIWTHWFGIKGTIKLGIKSLWMHRLRSALTTLGIVFGVCSVIAMLAIGTGASQAAQQAIARLGSTNLIIETVKPPEEQADSSQEEGATKYGLTYDDAKSILDTIPNVKVAVIVRKIPQEVRYLRRKLSIEVVCTVPWYTEVSPIKIIKGRFLTDTDLTRYLSVCVIDRQLAEKLFAFDEPIGKNVKIYGNFYQVVGIADNISGEQTKNIMNNTTTTTGGGVFGNMYIPLTTAKSRFTELTYTFTGGSRNLARIELHKIIVKVDTNDEVLPTQDVIDSLLSRLHKKQDYKIMAPLTLLIEAKRTTRIFSIVLGSIATISLLVGGIGIMNIMLATVSERTREIGIRRALGARKKDIVIQFLSETLLLTLTGGLLGIILGSIIPYFVSKFGEMETIITPESLLLAFGISALIGITFGLYPAYRAANMNPIESLRHE